MYEQEIVAKDSNEWSNLVKNGKTFRSDQFVKKFQSRERNAEATILCLAPNNIFVELAFGPWLLAFIHDFYSFE